MPRFRGRCLKCRARVYGDERFLVVLSQRASVMCEECVATFRSRQGAMAALLAITASTSVASQES
jgi:hypothetical protein